MGPRGHGRGVIEMLYSQAIQFLYDLRMFGMKLGLETTRRLAAAAGNPHERLRFIHVAGTNGKGSTCAMLESIYRAAGLRVGLFTSPHLVSFTERLQVDRRPISQEDVAQGVEQIRGWIEALNPDAHPTFFEVVTILALDYFARQKCDLVVWETGLGGRLDATNIVTPLASVVTNVQLDHQQWLGNTPAEIAREKAGIIKPGIPVLTATDDPVALSVISEIAGKLHAPLTVVGQAEIAEAGRIRLALAGEHQRINAALALAVTRVLAPVIPVTDMQRRAGLETIEWAGRLQTVERPGGRVVLLDGAHNPAGAQTLASAIATRFAGRRPALVLGTMRDKDCAAICDILAPCASKIFLAHIGSDRAADPKMLAELCRRANPSASAVVCASVSDALEQAASEPVVVVAGSIHFVGEALEALGLASPSPERALNDYGASLGRQLAPASSSPIR
jgi:dihydrofolate synthase / folylpolyglutamate synthase